MALIPLYMCIALSHLHTKQRAHSEIKPTNERMKEMSERKEEWEGQSERDSRLFAVASFLFLYIYI